MVTVAFAAHLPIHHFRTSVLRAWGASVASDATLYHGFQVRSAKNLSIGARSSIGDDAILDARGGLSIGADVNLSTGVQIWTAQHDWRSDDFAYTTAAVVIEDHVWIGPRVTILPGSVLKRGCVVAAGAVVRGPVEALALVGGVPAKKIGERPDSLRYELPQAKGKTWWW
jgi:acetyltransferase-like isoleucine patch superfamily enzyme